MKTKPQKNELQLLSIPQVARLLNVKRETIEIWLQDPGVPRLFVGRSKQVRLPKKTIFRLFS